jgi:transcriptional regulator with XRE-family HTH domain
MGKKNIKAEYLKTVEHYHTYFRLALTHLLTKKPQSITAAALGAEVGISASSISGFVHPDPARRIKPSFAMQCAIAKYAGYEYTDFLELGREISRGTPAANDRPSKLQLLKMAAAIFDQMDSRSDAMAGVILTFFRDMRLSSFSGPVETLQKLAGAGRGPGLNTGFQINLTKKGDTNGR